MKQMKKKKKSNNTKKNVKRLKDYHLLKLKKKNNNNSQADILLSLNISNQAHITLHLHCGKTLFFSKYREAMNMIKEHWQL